MTIVFILWVLLAVLGAMTAVVWLLWRRLRREWNQIDGQLDTLYRRIAENENLWRAEVAYGAALRELHRWAQIAAGRRIAADPRVEAALITCDTALATVMAAMQSVSPCDTPAGDDVRV